MDVSFTVTAADDGHDAIYVLCAKSDRASIRTTHSVQGQGVVQAAPMLLLLGR